MRRHEQKKPAQMRSGIAIALALAALTGSTNACFLGTETSRCESGRRCRPGEMCAAAQDACIPIDGCGDGIVNPARDEICDDGNIIGGDGCSADCKSDEKCGNGTWDLDKGEECDDGNLRPGDGCSSTCTREVCGNSRLEKEFGEVCDDGNAISGDGCRADCKSNEACGNNILDSHLGEECDDFPGPLFPDQVTDTPTCDSDCTLAKCGDGHLNRMFLVSDASGGHFEECDSGMFDTAGCDGDCTFARCGDGYLNMVIEECDEGPDNDNYRPDACRTDCRRAHCGDHVVDPTNDEKCEDHNNNNNDDCPDGPLGTCKPAECGDGFRDMQGPDTEDCDSGGVDTATCDKDCTLPTCGDGHVNMAAGEGCEVDGECAVNKVCMDCHCVAI